MADLINRQAAINALCNDYCGGHQDCKHYPKCENLRSVQNLPSAQPERENESVGCGGCRYDWFGDPRCNRCARSFQDYYEADMRGE